MEVSPCSTCSSLQGSCGPWAGNVSRCSAASGCPTGVQKIGGRQGEGELRGQGRINRWESCLRRVRRGTLRSEGSAWFMPVYVPVSGRDIQFRELRCFFCSLGPGTGWIL